MEGTSYLAYIPILVALYLATIHLTGKLQKLPPSPFLYIPVIGHLYLAINGNADTLTNLSNRLGPVLYLWFGSRKTLLVSSPSAAEDCLNKNDLVFCNRASNTLAGKYRGYDDNSLNFASYGPHWRNLRKIATVEMLSSHRLHSLAAIRADELRLLVKRLCGMTNVVMGSEIFDTTLNIMTRMLFGERYYGLETCSDKAKRLKEFVVESIRLVTLTCIGDDVPCLRWLDWRAERRFREYTEKRDRLMVELMEEQRNKRKENDVDTNNMKPMVQTLLELQDSNAEYYRDRVIHSLMADLLIGSSETSTNILEWAFSLLLDHPQILNKVRTEIDNHVGYSRLIEEPDLNHLPYLRCIINETLRMHPPLPCLFPHQSSTECVVAGHRIPSGTFLLINIHAIQNDPKFWDDPQTFKPERFQGVEGHKIGYKMMPFGSGRRSCPGEGLAIRVMGMVLGTLIQCLDMERAEDNQLVKMAQNESFNQSMPKPLVARIQPRHVMIDLIHKV
ncbi:cytochrome P450 81Q32-like [Silene latifolia]|uniref:cytochrome P450 81Q32-like n=1 Tax=Silene latifolia TaxID=37657 RepID=UPI003D7897DC